MYRCVSLVFSPEMLPLHSEEKPRVLAPTTAPVQILATLACVLFHQHRNSAGAGRHLLVHL